MSLNKINGGELFGRWQTRQILDVAGVPVEHMKGKIVFKNNIDPLDFLLNNRSRVGELIGVPPGKILSGKRDLGLMGEYLSKMEGKFDLGDSDKTMQMYISKHDDNTGSLDSQTDWVDYMMTQDWIDRLKDAALGDGVVEDDNSDVMLLDHRLEILADMVQGMVTDHEIEHHQALDKFKKDLYMDKPSTSYQKAMNELHSISALEYGFYELFKPIGNSTEKYIKVKLSTMGTLDVSGVVGLQDCEHIEWKYGSKEYLRSLDTGNQMYVLGLSRGWNDSNSVLWWKLDEPELKSQETEIDSTGLEVVVDEKWIYYKPYETERFLRWFGTDYIPFFDLPTINKKTICSIPVLDNDVESDEFHADATNNDTAQDLDLTKNNIDRSTSLSLLTLATKSTIDVVNNLDEDHLGQYIVFVVSGHQQTSNISFHIQGQMYNVIPEMNHFDNTWNFMEEMRKQVGREILFLQTTKDINPTIETVWNKVFPKVKWIPDDWQEVLDKLESVRDPTVIDLIRFRTLDLYTIAQTIDGQATIREDFIHKMDEDRQSVERYLDELAVDGEVKNNVLDIVGSKKYWYDDLYNWVMEYTWNEDPKYFNVAWDTWFRNIPLPMEIKEVRLTGFMDDLTATNRTTNKITYDDVTVEMLRERISTYNTLIVRLPFDTPENTRISRQIFLDWKTFVDKALKKLQEEKDEDGHPMLYAR